MKTASIGLGTQVAEGSGQLQDKEVVQSIETSESARSDIMSESTEGSDKVGESSKLGG